MPWSAWTNGQRCLYIQECSVRNLKKNMMRKFSSLGPEPNLTYEMFNMPCVANFKTNKQKSKTRSQFLQKQRADTEPPSRKQQAWSSTYKFTFCYNMYNSSNDARISPTSVGLGWSANQRTHTALVPGNCLLCHINFWLVRCYKMVWKRA